MLHYQVGWNLNKAKGVHFGLWYPETKNLSEAIVNLNEKVGEHITKGEPMYALDAGSGIGRVAMHLAHA